MSLLDKRDYYKPFAYPWAYEGYRAQESAHWNVTEIPMRDDIADWNKLKDTEKHLLTQIFRFFTTADVDVAQGYLQKYGPVFGGQPEIAMMLATFAGMESIHIDAYATLIDTLNMPETEFKAFMEYDAMKSKHEYLSAFNPSKFRGDYSEVEYKKEIAKTLAVYSAFTEGLQLFSSFAILMNFPRFNKMKNMGKVVTWSIRDETIHVNYMIKLFNTFVDENPEIWNSSLRDHLYEACKTMVTQEDKFIDLCFELGGVEGMEADDIKQYIRYIADRRLLQLKLEPRYGVKDNPLPWLDELLNTVEHGNFFEVRASEYSKGTLMGSWEDVWKKKAG
jgi:ribonucleoside-diphosphate reductase beta chain